MTGQLWQTRTQNGPEPFIQPAKFPLAAVSKEPRRDSTFKFGRCEVSIARREVRVDGELRALQPRPFDLLVFLIENRERVVSTDELLDRIWEDEIVQPGSLAAAIMRVRKALLESQRDAASIIIRTYQRVGYRFIAKLDGEDTAG
jgi:DNA-binding winged helix-turn-helix (wHTH) protein